MNVSRETEARLEDYEKLIRKWNGAINLIASSTLADLRARHIDDCVHLAQIAGEPDGHWVDLGSGAGFPGIVIALIFTDSPLRVTLVESDQRKAEFLRTAIRSLGLQNASVIADRIEHIPPLNADHLSARALAPLPKMIGYAHRHLAPHGTAWLMKGRSWRAECDEARADWRFALDQFPSITDPDAAILRLTGVSHA